LVAYLLKRLGMTAIVVLLLMVFLAIWMVLYLRSAARAAREATA
jgi:cbb3-type cytochrome oxidase subunit 3